MADPSSIDEGLNRQPYTDHDYAYRPMLMVNDGKITKVVPKLEVKSEGAQPKRIKIVFPGSRKRTSLSVDPNHGGKAAKVVVENSSRAIKEEPSDEGRKVIGIHLPDTSSAKSNSSTSEQQLDPPELIDLVSDGESPIGTGTQCFEDQQNESGSTEPELIPPTISGKENEQVEDLAAEQPPNGSSLSTSFDSGGSESFDRLCEELFLPEKDKSVENAEAYLADSSTTTETSDLSLVPVASSENQQETVPESSVEEPADASEVTEKEKTNLGSDEDLTLAVRLDVPNESLSQDDGKKSDTQENCPVTRDAVITTEDEVTKSTPVSPDTPAPSHDSREEESLPATPPSQPIGDNLALERRSLLVNGRLTSCFPCDMSVESLDELEHDLRNAASAIKETLAPIDAERKKLSGERVHWEQLLKNYKEDHAAKKKAVDVLKEKVSTLLKEAVQRTEERNHLAETIMIATRKLLESELALRELQVTMLNDRMTLLEGGHPPQSPLHASISENNKRADELERTIVERGKALETLKESLSFAEARIERTTTEENILLSRIDSAEKKCDNAALLVTRAEKSLQQTSDQLDSLLLEYNRLSYNFVDLEKVMVKIKACRKLKALECKQEKFIGPTRLTSGPDQNNGTVSIAANFPSRMFTGQPLPTDGHPSRIAGQPFGVVQSFIQNTVAPQHRGWIPQAFSSLPPKGLPWP